MTARPDKAAFYALQALRARILSRRVNIRTKLNIGFAIAAAFLVAVGIAAVWLIHHLNHNLQQVRQGSFQLSQVTRTMDAMHAAPGDTRAHLVRLMDLQRGTRSDHENKLIEAARQHVVQIAHEPAAVARALERMEALANHYRRTNAEAVDRLLVLHDRAVIGLIVAIADGVILLLILMYLVRIWLLNPLERLHGALERLAAGELHHPIQNSSAAEIGALETSLSRVAETLRALTERLHRAERLAVLGESCSSVAHSMRSLAASIRALAEYESAAERVNPDARAAFDYIIATAHTLEGYVTNMMNSMRTVEARLAAQSLEPILHNALTLVAPRLSEKSIDVELNIADDMPNVNADHALLEQALVAILINAIEASPEKAAITVSLAAAPDDMVVLSIRDCGPGMTDEIKQRACAPFFTTKPTGTGLGLTIARRNLELHHGRLDIESEPDKFTCIHIRLPAARAAQPASIARR
jgi:signal transduction histidine kinase